MFLNSSGLIVLTVAFVPTGINIGVSKDPCGGIKGTIKAVDETSVIITVNSNGTEMTFEKPAIKQVDPSKIQIDI